MEMTRSNPKAFDVLKKRIAGLDGVEGRVGWFESAKYKDGTPVAYVAAIQEFGSGPIPPRPFMRSTAKESKPDWIETAKGAGQQVLAGKITGAKAMELLTIKAKGDVAKKIESITTPPLSPITLAARKYRMLGKKVTGATIGMFAKQQKEGTLDTSGVSTKPLIGTRNMIDTLSHNVTTK